MSSTIDYYEPADDESADGFEHLFSDAKAVESLDDKLEYSDNGYWVDTETGDELPLGVEIREDGKIVDVERFDDYRDAGDMRVTESPAGPDGRVEVPQQTRVTVEQTFVYDSLDDWEAGNYTSIEEEVREAEQTTGLRQSATPSEQERAEQAETVAYAPGAESDVDQGQTPAEMSGTRFGDIDNVTRHLAGPDAFTEDLATAIERREVYVDGIDHTEEATMVAYTQGQSEGLYIEFHHPEDGTMREILTDDEIERLDGALKTKEGEEELSAVEGRYQDAIAQYKTGDDVKLAQAMQADEIRLQQHESPPKVEEALLPDDDPDRWLDKDVPEKTRAEATADELRQQATVSRDLRREARAQEQSRIVEDEQDLADETKREQSGRETATWKDIQDEEQDERLDEQAAERREREQQLEQEAEQERDGYAL